MRYLQIVDIFTSAGGMERFIYNFTRLLESKGGIVTAVAALEIEDKQNWGDAPIQTECLEDNYQEWESFVRRFSPDLIIWHCSPKSAAFVEQLSKQYLIVSTVHGVLCPAGSRLHRDQDEICFRKAGYGCLPRWFIRKCGSDASPYHAVESIISHNTIMKAMNSCHLVYSVSDAIKQFLMIEGISENKIRVFDNTLGEIEQLPPIQIPSNTAKLKLLYVGRLVYAKGAQYLIRAVRILQDKGVSVECSIAGEGWYKEKLVDLVKQLNVSLCITFVGKIHGQEINQWYAESDVVVVPSIWPDPSPLVVPEARMMGKPVVVFDAGGLPEWAEIMDGIYIADHADAQSLADTIASVVDTSQSSTVRPAQKRIDIVKDILEGMVAY